MENLKNFEYYFKLEKLNLQNHWRKRHRIVLSSCSLIVILCEIIMYGILKTTNNIFLSEFTYFHDYLLIPFFYFFVLNAIVQITLCIKKIPSSVKNYIISIGFDLLCLGVCFLHDVFLAVFASGILSIFLTVIYCDNKLTIATTTVLLFGETIIGVFGNWDIETVKDFYYLCSIGFFDVFLLLACGIAILINKWEEKRIKATTNYILQNTELKQEVLIDPLTGLKNRRALRNFIDENTNQLTFVMADINKFKTVNDTWGHLQGDKILTDFSDLIKVHIHEHLHIFRYGGDEFLFVFSEYPENQIADICYSIIKAFHEMLPEEIKKCGCGISFGIAPYKSNEAPKDSLIRADNALYKAKISKKVEIVK